MKRIRNALLGATMTVVAAMAIVFGVSAPAYAASVNITGSINCSAYANGTVNGTFNGVWVSANSSVSGFASYTTSSDGKIGYYSYTLNNGGSYHLNMGCGGSTASWGQTFSTATISGTSYGWTCLPVNTGAPVPPMNCFS